MMEIYNVAVIDDEFVGSFLENDASDGALTAIRAYDCLHGECTRKPRFDKHLRSSVFGSASTVAETMRDCGLGKREKERVVAKERVLGL
ncbi:hypothetical protein VNO80_26785 [Phaseolus coccineus]|uniref:Uncharacterized protein n=1 Tax=Phaseolus coccineus TaxID=3886 RepID=A0AAN9QES5_PHACN